MARVIALAGLVRRLCRRWDIIPERELNFILWNNGGAVWRGRMMMSPGGAPVGRRLDP